MTASPSSPFDALAAAYDDAFTRSAIGTLQRRAVWRRLDAAFSAGDRVLELGCGTGEDAVHLARRGISVLATDAAAGMVEAARQSVEVRQLALEELSRLEDGPFAGAFSNFGGFNCVRDLSGPACALAALLPPGARLLLCVMGPLVPWEWTWYGLRGEPGRALRRLRPGGAVWRGLAIHYPPIGRVKRAFAPAFRARRVAAVGALLPPSYAEPWAARHPGLLARLDRWERRWETLPPLPWLADHYLLELERSE
jgi:SAM-dependent methyltransferase